MNTLFLWDIDLSAVTVDDLREFSVELSPDERFRADSYRFQEDRQRFVAGRALLRRILAGHAGDCAKKLIFKQTQSGKPYLVDKKSNAVSNWQFSFSKSKNRAVCVVCNGEPVGADVEFVKEIENVKEVAETIFSARDLTVWQQFPATEKQDAFYRGWTRKEAVSKVDGSGISKGVKQFSVPLCPLSISKLVDATGFNYSRMWLSPWPKFEMANLESPLDEYESCVAIRPDQSAGPNALETFRDNEPSQTGDHVLLDCGNRFSVPKYCRLTKREFDCSPEKESHG